MKLKTRLLILSAVLMMMTASRLVAQETYYSDPGTRTGASEEEFEEIPANAPDSAANEPTSTYVSESQNALRPAKAPTRNALIKPTVPSAPAKIKPDTPAINSFTNAPKRPGISFKSVVRQYSEGYKEN